MIDLEAAFRLLSIAVYGIVLFIALLLVCSGIGRMLRRKRKEQTYRPDEHEEHIGHESYRGERE